MNPALILAALLSWNPANGARGATTDDTLAEWANVIASVCQGTRECLTLAALASEETRFSPWVLDGSCNHQGWRALHHKDKVCDGGKAYGPWQVWADAWAKVSSVPPEMSGPQEYAAVALHLLRANPRGWMVYDAARADVDKWMRAHP
jgi:hypothetical protein